ncbi:MAG: 50S ribosomal protein L13 [Candidatus Pacebacteria bacterium]|nr:50S ribosomal protein L13 [Candidatus Paceibacterota bacterium]MCF7862914.1 50S ribosomal protein L13 [Candidatus Paceibacterota bacterium]
MKKKEDKKIEPQIVDATAKTLGRLASSVAVVLLGKNKSTFKRNAFSGSPVKVINASKMSITTEKLNTLEHKRYSGYPGGLTIMSGSEVIEKKGYKELLHHAISKMLPANKLKKTMIKNLTIEE